MTNDSRVEFATWDGVTRFVCHRPSRPDSDIGDYDYELSLEMKRQKIQRELMKLEQENLDKREEIIIKKDEAPAKIRAAAVSKASRAKLFVQKWSDFVIFLFFFFLPAMHNFCCRLTRWGALIFESRLSSRAAQELPEQSNIKDSPRKSSGSPKHKGGNKGQGAGKKEKKASVSSPVSESARSACSLLEMHRWRLQLSAC